MASGDDSENDSSFLYLPPEEIANEIERMVKTDVLEESRNAIQIRGK